MRIFFAGLFESTASALDSASGSVLKPRTPTRKATRDCQNNRRAKLAWAAIQNLSRKECPQSDWVCVFALYPTCCLYLFISYKDSKYFNISVLYYRREVMGVNSISTTHKDNQTNNNNQTEQNKDKQSNQRCVETYCEMWTPKWSQR